MLSILFESLLIFACVFGFAWLWDFVFLVEQKMRGYASMIEQCDQTLLCALVDSFFWLHGAVGQASVYIARVMLCSLCCFLLLGIEGKGVTLVAGAVSLPLRRRTGGIGCSSCTSANCPVRFPLHNLPFASTE